MKKYVSMLAMIVLLLQTLSGSLLLPSEVTAEGNQASVINDLVVTNQDGEPIDVDTTQETNANVQVSWSVNEIDVQSGYTEMVHVPTNVQIEEAQTGSLLVNEEEVGTYSAAQDGTVTVVFNGMIESYPKAEGVFTFPATIANASQSDQSIDQENASQSSTNEKVEEESASNSTATDTTNETKEQTSTDIATSESGEQNEKELTASTSNTKETTDFQAFATTEITENIITSVELQRIFGDGTKQLIEQGEEIVVENPYDDYIIQLDYQFALPNGHSYGDGSTYTIQVPEVFNIPIVTESSPENLLRQDGTIFGTFYTNGNDIIMTFNDKIETESDIAGSITLESSFDADYDGPAQPDDITFPIEGDGSVSFPIKFIPKGSAIDKQGVPNKKYNTETITWTVDFNKNLQEINNATLIDEIVEGEHQFVEDSLKVYQLEMNADGTVNQEQLTDVTDQYEATFPLALGNITNAYRVVYDTEVTDNVGQSYKNKATLSGDDFTSLETEASVSVERGEPLDKNAIDYDNVEQTITWQVKFNYDEKSIPQNDARLTDIFGDNQTFVDGSVMIEEVDIDPDTGEEVATREVSNYQITETSDGLDVQFDNDIDKAYKITYQTTATDRVFDDTQITNTISDEFSHEVTGEQRITQGVFIKSHRNQGTNYNAKETSWRLVINRDQYTMENIVVTDTLPQGFTPDDVSISHGGEAWTEGDQYTFAFDDTTQKITITFNQTITDRVEINYTTVINFDEVDTNASQFTNNATLEWNIPGDSTTLSKEGQATFTPDNYTVNNGFKNGTYNYETKEITWRVGVNYNKASLIDVIVEDFIQGNQNFTIDNLKVYEMTLTGGANGYEKGAEITGDGDISITEVTNAQSEPGFQVSFGDINTPYLIEYTTDLTDELIEKTYNNTATIKTDNREDIPLDAKVSIDHGGEYINKDAEQNASNPRVVNWDVRINYTQSNVGNLTLTDENLKLTDTPSINQTLLRDTFKLYGTEVTPSGITKDEQNLLEEGTDYTITFTENDEGQESFTIEFIDSPIERGYFLEYDTYILYAGNEMIENDMKFNADGTDSADTDDTFTEDIDFSRIFGTIRGEVGSLQVNKVNFDDPGETLEGAVFELYDETGEVLLKTATTDTNGVASFNNLLYADYILKEAKAPEGYVVGISDQKTVTIDQPTTEETIANKPIKRHVHLIKRDGTDGTLLPNVTFELRNTSDDTVYGTYETDSNGEILVEDLPAGDYYFVETAPASDYQANDQMYNFTIEEKQTEVDEQVVENELIPGRALITKVDADNNTGLAGAEFAIHKESRTGEVVRKVTTEQDGTVNTGDLRPGDYVLVETKAPKGYQISQSAQNGIEFEIVRSQAAVLELSDISNEVKTTSIELTKTDSISGQTLANAEYELTYDSGNYDLDPDPMQGTTNANGKVTFDNLKPGTYQLTETKAPDGYLLDTTPIEIEVTLDDVDINRTISVDATNDPYVTVDRTKTWNDDDISDRPTEITVYLLQNGQRFKEATITEATDWQYSFTDLPKYDQEGVLYKYTVEEMKVEGYTTTINGFDITNTRSEQTDIVVQKTWLDDDASDRPTTIHVDLLRNGEPFDEVDITANENWTHTFEDLEAYDEDGQSILYTVKEAPVSGYQTTIDGYNITNVRVGTTAVEGSKTWKDDDPSDRPVTITVNLLQNGRVIETQEVSATADWQYSFTDLEQYDEEGKAYTYTVKEQGVPGYQSETAGYDLINTRAEKTTVAVTKTWLDDQASDRPTSITVTLLANGEPVDEVDITADQDWSYKFEDLEAYDVEGQPITYTIEEAAKEGYQTTINGYDITNVRVGTTSVEGSKTWKDDHSSDRPETITVNLLQNGIVIDTQEVTKAMNWQYSFSDLEQYDEEGVAYSYRIEEEKVVGYQTTVDGYNLINTFVPATPSKDKTDTSKSDLPSTATDMFKFILFGMLLLFIGLVAYWLVDRRKRKE